MGSVTLFDDDRKRRYLELRRDGIKKTPACRELHITPTMVRHACTTDEAFKGELELIDYEAVEEVEEALKQAALEGSVPAIKFFLTNRAPAEWEERQVIDNQGTPQTQVSIAISVTDVFARLGAAKEPAVRAGLLELNEGPFALEIPVDEDVIELEPAE